MRQPLRIGHVVTLISATGAFGGPVAVALSQATAQIQAGHSVTLIAGWDGVASLNVPGLQTAFFPVKSLKKNSLTSLWSVRILAYLWANADNFDVFHVHLGRDLVSLPAGLVLKLRTARFATQTHGMVMPDRRRSVAVVDWLLMRPVLRAAAVTLVLTEAERLGIVKVSRHSIRPIQIHNGVSIPSVDGVIRDFGNVLFLARLASRKRPQVFVEAAEIIAGRFKGASFSIVGPDEGELDSVLDLIKSPDRRSHVVYEGSVNQGEASFRIAKSGVYVLPSVGEVFPMSVLEAMSVGTPVVVTTDCGLAALLEERDAAVVTGLSAAEIASGAERLLTNRGLWLRVQKNALNLIRNDLNIERVAEELEAHYRFAMR